MVKDSKHTASIEVQVSHYFDEAAAVFDTFYDDQRSPFMRWVDHHFRRDMYERFERTFMALAPLDGKTVLDIGCGSGPYAVECARRAAARVVGLDAAESMLALARQRAAKMGLTERCTFITGRFPDMAPNQVFDHTIVMGVMDYVPDPLGFLRALAGCTRQSAVISFPSFHWFRGPLRIIRYKLKRCPLWLYQRDQIAGLLQSAGFASFQIDKIAGAGMDYVAVALR
jgi:cyclopropane fatty-acyl-phospholipid synthase-like methyltransferase